MKQMHTYSFMNIYCPCDLKGTIMRKADETKWVRSACLYKIGTGGELEPGAAVRTLG